MIAAIICLAVLNVIYLGLLVLIFKAWERTIKRLNKIYKERDG